MSKKICFVTILAILLCGTVNVWATASRMKTLGNQSLYLVDDTNAFSNPATLNYYRNCMFLHMGGYVNGGPYDGDLSTVGAISFKLSENAGLGFIVGGPGALVMIVQGDVMAVRMDAIMNGAFVVHPVNWTPSTGTTFLNPLGVILDYKVGNTALGVGYFYMGGKHNEDIKEPAGSIVNLDQNATLHTLALGLSSKMGKMQPEVFFHWDPYWVRSEYKDHVADFDSTEKLRGNRYYTGARLLYHLSDTMTIVPAVTYEHVGGHVDINTKPNISITRWGETFPADNLNQQYKIDTVIAGINAQYATGGFFGLLVTGSAAIEYSRFLREISIDKSHFDSTNTNADDRPSFVAPRVSLGLEYWANKTLCLRGGMSTTTLMAASKQKVETKNGSGTKTADDQTIETLQETDAAIGLGLHFGNLLIDTVFGNMFLTGENGGPTGQGPNLFSNLDIKVKW